MVEQIQSCFVGGGVIKRLFKYQQVFGRVPAVRSVQASERSRADIKKRRKALWWFREMFPGEKLRSKEWAAIFYCSMCSCYIFHTTEGLRPHPPQPPPLCGVLPRLLPYPLCGVAGSWGDAARRHVGCGAAVPGMRLGRRLPILPPIISIAITEHSGFLLNQRW